MSSTKAQNGENRKAIFTILRDLHRAKRGANRDIELTLIKTRKPVAHAQRAPQVFGFYI